MHSLCSNFYRLHPLSLHNLARVRDHRIRTQRRKPCRDLIRTMMPASDRDRMSECTIDDHDSRILPLAGEKRRNLPDSNPAGHDRDDRIVPGFLRKRIPKRMIRVPDHLAAAEIACKILLCMEDDPSR